MMTRRPDGIRALWILLISTSIASPRVLAAQEAASGADSGPIELTPIIVEAATSRLEVTAPPNIGVDPFAATPREVPATVNVLPDAFIEERGPRRLRDVADYIPGVTALETSGGTGDSFIVRGFEVFEPSLNGRLPRTFTNQSRSFANIERVEVLKGAAGVEAGISPPGGVINFVTKKPQALAARSLEAEVGSFDSYGVVLDATGPLGPDDRLLYRFIAEGRDEGSFRDTYESEGVLVAPSLQWNYGAGSSVLFELEYAYRDQPYDRGIFYLEGAGFDDDFAPIERSLHEPGDSLKSHKTRASLSVDHRLTDIFSLRGALDYIYEDYESRGARNPNPEDLYIPGTNRFNGNPIVSREFTAFDGWSEEIGASINGIAEFAAGGIDHAVLVGASLSELDRRTTGRDGQTVWPINALDPVYGTEPTVIGRAEDGVGRDFRSLAEHRFRSVYGQYRATVQDRLRLLAGIRYDDAEFRDSYTNNVNVDPIAPFETYGDEVVSFRLGTSYDLTDRATVFATFSNANEPQPGRTAPEAASTRSKRRATRQASSWRSRASARA